MSKPTLEERVAALEDRIGAHENALSGHRKVMGDIEVFVGMASPPPATSDPQEPYRLDTKPRTTVECPECHQQTEWPRTFPDGKQNPFCDKCGGKIGIP